MGTIQMTEPTNLDKVLSTKAKFIFITGGVVSSLGKGLASASPLLPPSPKQKNKAGITNCKY